jgi:histidinol-phosphate aminotransferase
MRFGYTVSHPEVALRLDQLLTAPYNLGVGQMVLARHFAEIRPHVTAACDAVIEERERLRCELDRLGLHVYPSEANFLLLRTSRAAELYEALAREGVRVRYAPLIPGLEGHLRITVGTREEGDMLLELLVQLLAS